MQQSWSTLLFVSLGVNSVLGTPITKDDSAAVLVKRGDPSGVTVAMAPGNSPDCGGKVWSPDELIAAIQQATDYEATQNYQGKDSYPHEFKNRPQTSLNPIKWLFDSPESFDFPNCPTGPLLEFPLMRDTSNTLIFQGGKNRPGKNNPDRVIFTFQSNVAATYCGVITHQKEDDDDGILDLDWWEGEMYTGDFRGCNPLF
ncbi:MAG: hypothetical protein HETSPECPRED_000012 [Heterodermia speciosa]|uniref:Effector protein n=1 Tax=Heterodermia speciosa TaxID=116794 RepID=A0A8H3I6Y9_9LECA|nr:MAG: hypothetical protein HETSPECPRED_000012 [Heterodermia speciosa]